MNTFREGWYIVYTKPRHEKKVRNQLSERQIDTFLPLIKKLRIWHDRKKYVDEPLFPSYVFVYLNDMRGYYETIDAAGVLYYVRSGGTVARVNNSIVNNIRICIDQGSDIEVSESQFQPGQQMLISQGPFTGLSCEVVQVDGSQKILVRVNLLQRNLLVEMSSAHVMSASGQPFFRDRH